MGYTTVYAAFSADVPSALGSGMSVRCDGTDDYISFGDSDDFSFGDGSSDSPFSVSMWVKVDAVSTDSGVFLSKYSQDGSADEWCFGILADELYAWVNDESENGYRGRKVASLSSFISDKTWAHVGFSYNGNAAGSYPPDTGVKIYVNGVQRDSDNFVGGAFTAIEAGASPVEMNRPNAGIAGYVAGSFDDVRIYGAELAAADFVTLTAGGNPSATLVAHWTFDSDRGTAPAQDLVDRASAGVGVGPGTDLGVVVDGDPVQQVLSKEGNAYAFSQSTAAKKPIWNYADANANGQSTLSFDGVDDWMKYDGLVSSASAGVIFVVFRPTSLGAAETPVGETYYDGQEYVLYFNDTAAPVIEAFPPHYGAEGTEDSVVAGTTHLCTLKSDGSAYSIRLDGDEQTVAARGSGNNGDWFGDRSNLDTTVIGAWLYDGGSEGNKFHGEIAEVLIYGAALSTSDIERVERYLAAKYGLTLSA
jgi:hypothetical protein